MSKNEKLIANLSSDISALHENIQANQEKLQRLRQAKHYISNEQEELSAHRKFISEPELSPSNWAGKHASKFLNIRMDIEQSHMVIMNQQAENILTEIEGKIDQLKSMNSSYSDSIASKNYRISRLNSK